MEKMEEENSTEETGSLKKENIISCDLMMTNKTGIIAPVIIEEIDGNETDVDFNEFVEAEALKMTDISNYLHYDPSTSSTLNDIEEQECLRWQIEEDKLTKQFLNGEIEFCEYSLRMDKDTDLEVTDSEFMRRDGSNEQIARQRSSLKKSQRASNIYKQKRKRRTLPPALQGLMGEANLRFARGDIDLATKICMEIIRQVFSHLFIYFIIEQLFSIFKFS
ncbi:uncharacterized protein [Prorops nasuta]|uniref:uncharacterized protein n=1 Tax=Prorops nasuta TaxID=863751 RepID=UPI0034CE8679